VDASIQVYKREPIVFILSMALLYVPWLVVRLVVGQGPDEVTSIASVESAIITVLFTLVYIFSGGVTTALASDVYLGTAPDLKRAFRRVGARFAPLAAVMVAVGILSGLAAFLLVLPAFYVIARFCAVQQLVVLEGKNASESFSRSSALTLGLKWHCLKTFVLMFLIVLAINLGASLLVALVPSNVVRETGSAVITVLVLPIIGITQTLLYYDLRIRKEGFDVEFMAAQAATGTTAVDTPSAAL
ncbi:MAG TPA: hypothetical protein VGM50_20500, partial [Gemmatimonadaceae bacterium]